MLYRISEEDLGPEVRMDPRIPRNREDKEDDQTFRICVAASVAKCLESINSPYKVFYDDELELGIELTVYGVLLHPKDAYENLRIPTKEQVADAAQTGEQWLLASTTFKRQGTIRSHARSQEVYWRWLERSLVV